MTFDLVIYSIVVFLSIILFTVMTWILFNRYIKLSEQKELNKLRLEELDIDIKSLLVLKIWFSLLLLLVIVFEYIKSLP